MAQLPSRRSPAVQRDAAQTPRPPRDRAGLLLVAASLLGVLAWGAARTDDVAGRPLVVLWDSDPGTYDPQGTSNPTAQAIFRHVCEPLFAEDESGRVHGLLAETDYAFDRTGRRLTIRLRADVTFHDGTPLDAAAVAASFARLVRMGVSPLTDDLRDVRVTPGADARTVAFALPAPDFEFVRLVLANPYAAVVSPGAGEPAPPGLVACTGPYRYAPSLYHPGHRLDLVRHPRYTRAAAGAGSRSAARIPRLRFAFVADRQARFDALLAGDACVLSLGREQMAAASDRTDLRRYDATGGVTFLGFNFQRPRWQDRRARQAVALAVDKRALADLGPFAIAHTPLAPNAVGYDAAVAAAGYRHDPASARTLLDAAAFDRDAEVVLLVAESNTYAELAAELAAQLAALDLRVRVRSLPRADILSRRQDFDLLLFDYAWGDYTALAIFLGPGPRNLLGYGDRHVADRVREARAIADPVTRAALVQAAQRTVLSEAVWQPLLVRRIVFAVSDRCVRGERQSPAGDLLFHDAVTAPFVR